MRGWVGKRLPGETSGEGRIMVGEVRDEDEETREMEGEHTAVEGREGTGEGKGEFR